MAQRVGFGGILKILIHHMGVNHGRVQILMPEHFFKRAYIHAVLVHQCGCGMTKFMYRAMLLGKAGGAKVVSTGLADILLPVTAQALDKAVQDRAEVLRLSEYYDVVGFHLFCPDEKNTARCRNFAPRYDIDEEAATGTSNGALTWLLYEAGRIREEEENSFLQGEAMGKPSLIRSRLTMEEDKPRIRVGGPAVVNLKLELL